MSSKSNPKSDPQFMNITYERKSAFGIPGNPLKHGGFVNHDTGETLQTGDGTSLLWEELKSTKLEATQQQWNEIKTFYKHEKRNQDAVGFGYKALDYFFGDGNCHDRARLAANMSGVNLPEEATAQGFRSPISNSKFDAVYNHRINELSFSPDNFDSTPFYSLMSSLLVGPRKPPNT